MSWFVGLTSGVATFVGSRTPLRLLATTLGITALLLLAVVVVSLLTRGGNPRLPAGAPALLVVALTFLATGMACGAAGVYLFGSASGPAGRAAQGPSPGPTASPGDSQTSQPPTASTSDPFDRPTTQGTPSNGATPPPRTGGTAAVVPAPPTGDAATTSVETSPSPTTTATTTTTTKKTTSTTTTKKAPTAVAAPATATLTKPGNGDRVAQCTVVEGTSSNLPDGMTLVTVKHQGGKPYWYVERPDHWGEPALLGSWKDTQTFNDADGQSFTVYVFLAPLAEVEDGPPSSQAWAVSSIPSTWTRMDFADVVADYSLPTQCAG